MDKRIGVKWNRWPEKTVNGSNYNKARVQIIGLSTNYFCVEHVGVFVASTDELLDMLLPVNKPGAMGEINE